MIHRLTEDERQFFSLVRDAVRANPFSEARQTINRRIAGFYGGGEGDDSLARTIDDVERRMAGLREGGRGDLSAYGRDDGELLKYAHLFALFHRHIGAFDSHIIAQAAEGARVLPVPFAEEALGTLVSSGFSEAEALRFFALSFQIRRAFYFIDRGLPGLSPSMVSLREDLWNNVFTSDIDLYESWLVNRMEDFSTLLLGETGTGKGSAAQAIGRSGFIPFDAGAMRFTESFAASFVSVNLSQFSETLVESELFGHTKGSFTGAVKDHEGIFSTCSPHGAIFLDEIGEVSPGLQIKLLKVLEERTYTPVGSRMEKRFSGRIIAATNRPPDELTATGRMRDDFFYRLCSDLIVMPPLRTRLQETPDELGALVDYTVARIIGKPAPDLSAMVTATIEKDPGRGYPWPGNVRELAQCVRRILLKRRYTTQAPEAEPPDFAQAMAQGRLTATELLQAYCHHLWSGCHNIGEVARKTGLDRRTAKKHIDGFLARA
ncbi:sigma-54-dependent transcriptional regulator [Desulfoluna spongiiphila]|uniref:sigma-54-dependent transcriptional regulator n=1 Tax=Desulfoluna spongiiphila TaxID=419481 RepID=UPI0012530333|nr:sigma 54-interacting transcriptional regulator [Desulfoluna spongiiphila]VVS90436.1 rna polymerase sigma factor 54 interaction domain [Desulfoluna spongiiphila]